MHRVQRRRLLTIALLLVLLLPAGITPQAASMDTSFECGNVSEIPQVQCEALVALYNGTDGDNWLWNTDWLDTNTPCSWYGVTCRDGDVVELDLSGYVDAGALFNYNGLRGSIPPEIGNLVQLELLDLSVNYLNGLIPPEIGNLSNLRTLRLFYNELTSIPPEIGNLTGLGQLDVSSNELTSIPPEIGNLTGLGHLDLSSNQLTSMPEETWDLTGLRYLRLSWNELTDFPPDIRNLSHLQHLDVSGNRLTSILPQIGNLTALEVLSMSNNSLGGATPPEIGNLTGLGHLDLSSNQLTSIPPEMGSLTGLDYLDLSSNELDGIPSEIGNLIKLDYLDLSNNRLPSVPWKIGNLSNLTNLYLSSNQLTSIPAEIGNLSNLEGLALSGNQLTSIPSEIGNLIGLDYLDLSNNRLPSVPWEIGNLSNLTNLYLSSNQLTSIPPEIENLTELWKLDLSGNQLASIPPEIGNLGLLFLHLDSNPLSGEVPAFLTSLKGLYSFYFYGTDWCVPPTGPVSEWLSEIPIVRGTGLVCGEQVEGPVIVRDSAGNPVSGAQVFRNDTLAGITAADGSLHVDNLAVGDRLVARQRVHEEPSPKDNHSQDASQNWAYRVYITSMDIAGTGATHVWHVSDPLTQTLTLKEDNTFIGFNIVASVEWDANAEYLEELRQGMREASRYLYNASNGQMLFERVTMYDDNRNWGAADYQVYASNDRKSFGTIGGLRHWPNEPPIKLGRIETEKNVSWAEPDGYSTLIHEFGHYGLNLYDSYRNPNGRPIAWCTSLKVIWNNTPEINATLMYQQYRASQFAMRGVEGLWSNACEKTRQWKKHTESDWETIADEYADEVTPARWTLKTPADYGAIVPGPTSIPVGEWCTVEVEPNEPVGQQLSLATCDLPALFTFSAAGVPATRADVTLYKGDRPIHQGKTDDQGSITVLGGSDGDRLIVNHWLPALHTGSVDLTCSTTQSLSQDGVGTIELEPAAFNLTASAVPGGAEHEIEVRVKASVALLSVPVVQARQDGADTSVVVPLTYDDALQAYTGTVTLNPDLLPAGTLLIQAENAQRQEVEIVSSFSLQPVAQEDSLLAYSADGQVDLYIPAGALSASGVIALEPSQMTLTLPEDLDLLSAPYTIQASDGLTLIGPATFSLRYLDHGDLSTFNTATAQVHRWEGDEWTALETTGGTAHQIASASVTEFGTYALLAERQHNVYLPCVVKDYDGTTK